MKPIALILAAVGLYGLLQYHTTQRTHEIGILLSTGYRPEPIFLSFLFESLVVRDLRTEDPEEPPERGDVPQARHPGDLHRSPGEQRRRHRRQHGVLRAGDAAGP